jgi:hypothetical protein
MHLMAAAGATSVRQASPHRLRHLSSRPRKCPTSDAAPRRRLLHRPRLATLPVCIVGTWLAIALVANCLGLAGRVARGGAMGSALALALKSALAASNAASGLAIDPVMASAAALVEVGGHTESDEAGGSACLRARGQMPQSNVGGRQSSNLKRR